MIHGMGEYEQLDDGHGSPLHDSGVRWWGVRETRVGIDRENTFFESEDAQVNEKTACEYYEQLIGMSETPHTIAVLWEPSHILDAFDLPVEDFFEDFDETVREPLGELVEWDEVIAFCDRTYVCLFVSLEFDRSLLRGGKWTLCTFWGVGGERGARPHITERNTCEDKARRPNRREAIDEEIPKRGERQHSLARRVRGRMLLQVIWEDAQ